MVTLISHSEEETRALGKKLGELLQGGDFIGLTGELGAGKTAFSRGVAEGTGAPMEDFSSPTYSILQSYSGRLPLHHADLYRLRSEDDLYSTGYFDLLDGDGALLVEWVGQVASAAPENALMLTLEPVDATTRKISAEARGARHQALLKAWAP